MCKMFQLTCLLVPLLVVAISCFRDAHGIAITTPPLTTTTATTSASGMLGSKVTVQPIGPEAGTWKVQDSSGNICMMMTFALMMKIGEVEIDMDPKTGHAASNCDSTERTLSIYPYGRVDTSLKVGLVFTKKGRKFSLTTVFASWTFVGGFDSGSVGQDNFLDQSVPLGKSYTCSKPLTVDVLGTTVQLSQMRLQPFAEEADGGFGEEEDCQAGSGSSTIIIVVAIVVAIVVVFIIIAVVIAVIVIKKRSRGNVPYGNMTNNTVA